MKYVFTTEKTQYQSRVITLDLKGCNLTDEQFNTLQDEVDNFVNIRLGSASQSVEAPKVAQPKAEKVNTATFGDVTLGVVSGKGFVKDKKTVGYVAYVNNSGYCVKGQRFAIAKAMEAAGGVKVKRSKQPSTMAEVFLAQLVEADPYAVAYAFKTKKQYDAFMTEQKKRLQ